jgi:hypothetical protein
MGALPRGCATAEWVAHELHMPSRGRREESNIRCTSRSHTLCRAAALAMQPALHGLRATRDCLKIADVCSRSGNNCGALSLELRFRALPSRLLKHRLSYTEPASMANLVSAFGEQKTNSRKKVDVGDRRCARMGDALTVAQTTCTTLRASTCFRTTRSATLPCCPDADEFCSRAWGSSTTSSPSRATASCAR